jgi:hypothetical protein
MSISPPATAGSFYASRSGHDTAPSPRLPLTAASPCLQHVPCHRRPWPGTRPPGCASSGYERSAARGAGGVGRGAVKLAPLCPRSGRGGTAHAASDDNLSQVPAGRHGSRGSRWRGGTDAVGGKGRALPRLTRGSRGDAPPHTHCPAVGMLFVVSACTGKRNSESRAAKEPLMRQPRTCLGHPEPCLYIRHI